MIETPAEIIAHHASTDAAEAFAAYRKGMGKRYHLTARAAALVARSLATIREQGGCPDEALDMAQERGWMTVKPDWYWNAKQQEGRALRVVNNEQLTRIRQHSDAHAADSRIAIAARVNRTPSEGSF